MVYDVLLPSIPVIIGYLGTYALYKTGITKKKIHVNIWHLIILIAFLISGGAGFLLVLLLDAGIALPINAQFLYWHVELGVTLVIVTIFHFHIYGKGFKAMFQLKRRELIHEKKDNWSSNDNSGHCGTCNIRSMRCRMSLWFSK